MSYPEVVLKSKLFSLSNYIARSYLRRINKNKYIIVKVTYKCLNIHQSTLKISKFFQGRAYWTPITWGDFTPARLPGNPPPPLIPS